MTENHRPVSTPDPTAAAEDTVDLWGGDDDAISNPADDAFGRAPFAKHLAAVIRTAPPASSFRIGIFGEWGEGKTSVMGLMEHYLDDTAFVCVRVSVWDVTDAKGIVRKVASALAHEAGTNTGAMAAGRALLTKAGVGLAAIRKAGADLDWKTKGLDYVLGDTAEDVANKAADFGVRKQIDAAVEQLGDRRAVVFVDDLDRADASGLPRVLMALREAVPVRGTVFVLALSADAVASAIEKSNYGLETAERFLEKIIEYPAYLPAIPRDGLHRYAVERVAAVQGLRRPEVLQDLAPLLPTNPRRLKTFLRKLSALRETLDRFDDEEVNWLALYLAQLLLSEFPRQTLRLREDPVALKEMESAWLAEALSSRSEKQERVRAEARYAPADAEERKRFLQLCGLFRDQHTMGSRYRARDLLRLDATPPVMTVREVRQLLERLETTPREAWGPIITEGIARQGRPAPDLASQFWRFVLEFREGNVGTSYRTVDPAKKGEAEQWADMLTAVLETVVTEIGAFRLGLLDAGAWSDLLTHVAPWANAREARGQAEMRDREMDLVERALDDVSTSVVELALQRIKHEVETPAPIKRPEEFVARLKRLAQQLEERVASEVFRRFEQPEGLAVLTYAEWNEHGKWFVLDSSSSFYGPPYVETLGALAEQAASGLRVIQENFFTLLRLLFNVARGQVSAASPQDALAILKRVPVARHLWRGATSLPLTETAAHYLQEIRLGLVGAGVDAAELPAPDWWHKDLGTTAGAAAATPAAGALTSPVDPVD